MTQYHSYDPADGHGLSHSPLLALIAPRPIGWISTYSKDGVTNLAPYSFFQMIANEPPILMICSAGWKDTVQNIQDSSSFVHNVVASKMSKQMVASCEEFPADVSEFAEVGLDAVKAETVNAPMIKGAAAAMECKLIEISTIKDIDGQDTESFMITGQVTRIHIDKAYINDDGMVDANRMSLTTRLGYRDYLDVTNVYQVTRPGRKP